MANLLYFGEDFPGNGYPRIDVAHGGNLDGILKVVNGWTGRCERFQIASVSVHFSQELPRGDCREAGDA
jgi:hypothetical protein